MVCIGSILNLLLAFKNLLGILSCHNQVKNLNRFGWLEIGYFSLNALTCASKSSLLLLIINYFKERNAKIA